MRNEATLAALVGELQRNCGDTLAAAKAVGVSLVFVNQWAKDDPKVKEQLVEAAAVGTQGLVSAAIQRAVHGVQEDIYYKGEVCGEKTVYSDGLLQTLLKAKVQEFANPGENGGQVNVHVQVANLMPRATTYEEWLAMKHQTAQPQITDSREKSLEALGRIMTQPGEEILEAEYAEVTTTFKGIDL
jgi:DNA-binding transcriptional regulator YdaS (Cro superfamily)